MQHTERNLATASLLVNRRVATLPPLANCFKSICEDVIANGADTMLGKVEIERYLSTLLVISAHQRVNQLLGSPADDAASLAHRGRQANQLGADQSLLTLAEEFEERADISLTAMIIDSWKTTMNDLS